MSNDQRPTVKSVVEATQAVDRGDDIASKQIDAQNAAKLKTCLAITQFYTQRICQILGHSPTGIEQIQLRLDVEKAMDAYIKSMLTTDGRRVYAGQISGFDEIISGLRVMGAVEAKTDG